NTETCRRYGIHAQTARQGEQTFEQISKSKVHSPDARVEGRGSRVEGPDVGGQSAEGKVEGSTSEDALLRCIMAGFIDQLCLRRDQGTLECDLTEGRHGTLMRESVVQNSPLLVAASIREVSGRGSENLTLLGLASAVKREWIEETFAEQITSRVEHLYDRTHKRVAAVKLVRFHDLVIH